MKNPLDERYARFIVGRGGTRDGSQRGLKARLLVLERSYTRILVSGVGGTVKVIELHRGKDVDV